MKFNTALLSALCLLTAASSQAATFYQVTAGANFWQNDGTVKAGEVADAQFTLQQDDQSNSEYYFQFEHGLPLLPNARYVKSDFSVSGSQTLTQTYILSGQTYRVASTLGADYEYDYTDYSLYYELFDNQVLEFDLGVTFKDIDANLAVVNQDDRTESSSRRASGIEPYLYTAAKLNLPLLNLGFSTILNVKDSDSYDFEFALQYQLGDMPIQPYVQLGWKKQQQNFEDFDSLYFNHDWDAAFAGIFFTF